jgi:hypothetical protein
MCSDTVPNYLVEDEMKSVKHLFPELLENYKVILFNGNFDMTIPNNGAEMWSKYDLLFRTKLIISCNYPLGWTKRIPKCTKTNLASEQSSCRICQAIQGK